MTRIARTIAGLLLIAGIGAAATSTSTTVADGSGSSVVLANWGWQ